MNGFLKVLRVMRGLRQADIERMSFGGIPQCRLSDLERGLPATEEELRLLAGIYQVPLEELRARENMDFPISSMEKETGQKTGPCQ